MPPADPAMRHACCVLTARGTPCQLPGRRLVVNADDEWVCTVHYEMLRRGVVMWGTEDPTRPERVMMTYRGGIRRQEPPHAPR